MTIFDLKIICPNCGIVNEFNDKNPLQKWSKHDEQEEIIIIYADHGCCGVAQPIYESREGTFELLMAMATEEGEEK